MSPALLNAAKTVAARLAGCDAEGYPVNTTTGERIAYVGEDASDWPKSALTSGRARYAAALRELIALLDVTDRETDEKIARAVRGLASRGAP